MFTLSFLFLSFVAPQASAPATFSPQHLAVPSGNGVEHFWVETPKNLESAAILLSVENHKGFRLTNRVVVRTAQPTFLEEVVASLSLDAEVLSLGSLQDWWLVSLSSVQDAANMANALAPIFGEDTYLDLQRPLELKTTFNDPKYAQQWHLENQYTSGGSDARCQGAWNAGYSGQGVILGVIDGGSQSDHPDLQANFNATASKNTGTSSHGTAVAGVMAAVANNGTGVVGTAYDAEWSRFTYGSSSSTADAFNYRNDLNDLKNNSWGPADDGNFHSISSVEKSALKSSAETGRGGLGEIFTWAAGNGGSGDRVDYDPYASIRYTIAVGALGDDDKQAYYSEQGSSMLVVAPSNGGTRGITTTDSGSGYTNSFGGTSSASPLAGGVIGLMLSANPNLSWRDVQHVLVHSSRMNHSNSSTWRVNGAGHDMSYDYGFGCVDAGAACALAATWTSVSPEVLLDSGTVSVNQSIPDNTSNGLVFTESFTQGGLVEHVELVLNATHSRCGDLDIVVEAPSGINSRFTKVRTDNWSNFNNYKFTSVRHWDENPNGTWVITISDQKSGTTGTLKDYRLKIYTNDGGHLNSGLTLASSALTSGATASFDISNGAANSPAWLAYSLVGLGSTPISQLGVTLGLSSPKQAGSRRNTNGAGSVTWNLPIPNGSAGVNVWLQALQMGEVSNIVSKTIQ